MVEYLLELTPPPEAASFGGAMEGFSASLAAKTEGFLEFSASAGISAAVSGAFSEGESTGGGSLGCSLFEAPGSGTSLSRPGGLSRLPLCCSESPGSALLARTPSIVATEAGAGTGVSAAVGGTAVICCSGTLG